MVKLTVWNKGSTGGIISFTDYDKGGDQLINRLKLNFNPAPEPGKRGISTPTGIVRAEVPVGAVRRPTTTTSTTSDYGVTYNNSSYDNYSNSTADYEVRNTAGTVYRVQIIAVKTFDPNHSRYRPVEGMGSLQTEYISDRDLTRVMLGDFYSMSEARSIQDQVQQYDSYSRAFIVEYNNGVRGRVIR